uniref:SAM domain-containing protein n=1 Tax=Meloidogyne hapla TaxID=6305 RepID=A0A1I8BQV7_MELHA
MVSDNIESRTQGGFQHRYNALLRLSTRVALNDVQQIRENYPNLFKLFKENGLDKLDALDSSTLTDSDLQCILLSQNAKRFVIARELLYASSSRFLSPAFHSILGSLPSFALCYYLRTYTKSNDLFTFISSLAIGVVFIYFLLESYYRIETLYLDSEAAKIDEDHKEGCMFVFSFKIE